MLTFPHVLAGAPLRVSATTYLTWLRCPQQARTRLDAASPPDARYPPETIHTFRGALAHAAIRTHLTAGPIADADLRDWCRREVGGSGLNETMARLRLKPSHVDGVIEEVGDLYRRFTRLAVEGFRQAEIDLRCVPAEGIELVGRVDAVFDLPGGGVTLVDWKTGQLGNAQPQLGFYAALWALTHGDPPDRVEAASVKTGERFEHRPTTGDVETTMGVIAEMVTTIRRALDDEAELDRQAGPWCRFCPIRDGCAQGSTAVNLMT